MNISYFIAKRYLISKKSNNAINIITWISVLAVAVGTCALVIILSGMNGLTGLVISLNNSFEPDLEIFPSSGKVIKLTDEQWHKLKNSEAVAAALPTLEDNVILQYNDKMCLARVKGVNENYAAYSRFDTLVFEGKFSLREQGRANAVFGKGIAYQLGINRADVFTPVQFFSPQRKLSPSLPSEEDFEEKKVYASGLFAIADDFDFKYVLMSYESAAELFNRNNEMNSVELFLKNGVNIEKVQQQLESDFGANFKIKNRYQQNEMLYKTLESEKFWTFLILVFIMIIATFNIVGALTMLILEKKKDLNVLSAMGASLKSVRRIFMLEGFMITLLGVIGGVLLGLLLCWMQMRFGLLRFDEGYIVEFYPMKIVLNDLFAIIMVVMAIGFAAAWYPVRKFTVTLANRNEF